MKKLVRYTSIEDLKASKNLFVPKKSDSERESDLKEFIELLKNHSSAPERDNSVDSSNNQLRSGK